MPRSRRREQLADDVGGFSALVRRLVEAHRLAAVAIGVQALALALDVVRDHRARGREDRLGRAVVAFEADDLRAREVLLEVEDVADVRLAEAVDRLILVADHAQVVMRGGEQAKQPVLDRIGVLVLVDEHELPAALVAREHVGVVLEESRGQTG